MDINDPDMPVKLWLEAELKKRGHGSKKPLAEYLGIPQSQIGRMLPYATKERRTISAGMLLRMQHYFGSSPEAPTEIPVMGYIGAGAEVMPDFEQVPPEGLDQVTVPFPLPDEMIAFKVRGDSMWPVFKDGHVIVVFKEQKKPVDAFYGLDAAVRTSDGRRFIKTITRGVAGVTLTSWNAAPIEDVGLEWVGEIFASLPPAAILKTQRQGGVQGQLALKTG